MRTAAPVVRWTVEQVLALAPDESSRRAGGRLGSASPWSGAGCDGSGAVWGLCKGSGSKPYRTVVDTTGPAYKCSCPSRKFPCKHALGLLLLWASDEAALGPAEVPDWAGSGWTAVADGRRRRPSRPGRRGRRRCGPGRPGGREAASRAPGRADHRRRPGVGAAADGSAARRPGGGRSGGVRAVGGDGGPHGRRPGAGTGGPGKGVGGDPGVRSRLAGAAARGVCAAASAGHRVARHRPAAGAAGGDGPHASGADGLRRWPTGPRPLAGPRPVRHPGRQDRHAPDLAVRKGLGPHRTAAVLRGGRTLPGPGPAGGRHHRRRAHAVSRGRAAEGGVGRAVRCAGADRHSPPGSTATAAVAAYGRALRDDPWLESWPVTLCGVIPVPSGDGWQLVDAAGDTALPVAPSALSRPGLWKLVAISGGAPVTVFGECGHRGFDPLAAWADSSDDGAAETVPLI